MHSIACLLANSTPSSMSHQSIRHRRIASAVGKSRLPFCIAGVHRCSGGLTVGSDGHRRRLPRIRGIRSSGVCSASGASTYSTASGLIRISTVLAPTLKTYRLTCSRDECGVVAGSLRRGGLSYISAVSFLFAFSVFGDVNRGLFFH